MITVICTTPKREMWLKDCLESLGERPVMVLSDYSYEIGKIDFMVKHTKIEKFLLLQDSVVFKDVEKFYETLAQHQGSVSINHCPRFYGSFMGVYERRILERMQIPVATSKKDQVIFEVTFNEAYVNLLGGSVPVLYPELHDENNAGFVERHGRKNMVLENDVMIKYKGTWNWDNL
jgi:hypothetical protein